MELYLTGIVLKPKGLKGELKVRLLTDYPDSFLKRREFYLGSSPETAVRKDVVSASLNQGFAWMFFEGISSREAAEAVVGYRIYVREDALEALPDDRAYIHDLIGLDVFDEDGRPLGRIVDLLGMPAHDVYEIEAGGRRVLVPAVDEFVVETDLRKGRMVLRRFSEFL